MLKSGENMRNYVIGLYRRRKVRSIKTRQPSATTIRHNDNTKHNKTKNTIVKTTEGM